MQLKEEDAAENRTGRKWLDKQHAQVDLLLEIIGKDTPIQNIDYDECLRVRSVVARMPANQSKVYKGLFIDEAISRAEAEHKPGELGWNPRSRCQKTPDRGQPGGGPEADQTGYGRRQRQAFVVHPRAAQAVLRWQVLPRMCTALANSDTQFALALRKTQI
jgi:hypothetical protein